MNKRTAQRWFIKTALSYLGKPYLWGGDDPSGFDCSGFVVECLKSVGLIGQNEDLSSESIRKRFEKYSLEKPERGALLFVLKDNLAVHVAICLDDTFHISALGGTSDTNNSEIWKEHNAFIKIRPNSIFVSQKIFIDPFYSLL